MMGTGSGQEEEEEKEKAPHAYTYLQSLGKLGVCLRKILSVQHGMKMVASSAIKHFHLVVEFQITFPRFLEG